MRQKNLQVLAGLTAAVAVLAGIAALQHQSSSTNREGLPRPIFEGLAAKINGVISLTVAGQDKSVTVSRPSPDSTAWTVVDRGGYPASADLVKKAVVGLAELQATEPRTAEPDKYARLGVDDIDHAGSTALRLSLRDASGELAALLHGKAAGYGGADGRDTFYARKPGEAESWLVEGQLELNADPVHWVAKDLPKLRESEVRSVTIAQPGSTKLEISRSSPEQHDFVLAKPPEGSKPKSAEVNRIAGALEYLAFDDVAKYDAALFKDAAVATFHGFDGVTITVRTARKDGKAWLAFGAAFEAGPSAEPAKSSPEAKGPPDAANSESEKPQRSAEDARQRVKAIEERYPAWAYRVSDFAAEALTRNISDLVTKEGS
ncbi:MAG: DUF4340 domain-containing protein [Azospirillum sp.]|nr:DUF4340 domain-containing protein [Azospirillum sp.]